MKKIFNFLKSLALFTFTIGLNAQEVKVNELLTNQFRNTSYTCSMIFKMILVFGVASLFLPTTAESKS